MKLILHQFRRKDCVYYYDCIDWQIHKKGFIFRYMWVIFSHVWIIFSHMDIISNLHYFLYYELIGIILMIPVQFFVTRQFFDTYMYIHNLYYAIKEFTAIFSVCWSISVLFIFLYLKIPLLYLLLNVLCFEFPAIVALFSLYLVLFSSYLLIPLPFYFLCHSSNLSSDALNYFCNIAISFLALTLIQMRKCLSNYV